MIRADSGSCVVTGVGAEVAVQKVVGVTGVTVTDAVVDTSGASVCTGTLVTTKLNTV